ncbi:MAG: hypothetical protein HY904_24700, partial [Deltaproteobacteria bacterium]|nr:hypothetical protein [Deltaproteobacteria bacterium]
MRTSRLPLPAILAAAFVVATPVRAQTPAPAPAPAAPVADKPLPYVAVVPFAPAAGIKPAAAHQGTLQAVLLEQAALSSPAVNVVTQGAQAEMLEDLGVKPGTPLDENTAKKLAQLSGATHVLFGSFEAGEGGALTYKVRQFGVLAGAAKDLVTVTGQPADVAARLAEALGRELSVPGLAAPAVPAGDKAQKGYAACVTFTAVALERAAVKGRKVTPPKTAMASCKDAGTDKAHPLSQGVLLAARLLTGDAKAAADLQKHVDANPADRLAGLVLLRRLFEDARYEEAAALLKRVQAARPRDPDVLRMAGELEIQKDSWDAARFAFQQAVNQAPNSPYLRYRLSYASYRTDNPKDAMEHARQALR